MQRREADLVSLAKQGNDTQVFDFAWSAEHGLNGELRSVNADLNETTIIQSTGVWETFVEEQHNTTGAGANKAMLICTNL